MGYIYILPIGNVPEKILYHSKNKLENTFLCSAQIMEQIEVPKLAFDSKREQYFSTTILKTIMREAPQNTEKIVGITSVDLFVPILTFVYGQAQLDGKAAVVSYQRLKQEFYGLPEDESLLEIRLAKELIHELGHTYGLVHCSDDNCVMHFSSTIMQVDIKDDQFCKTCTNILMEKL